jgi:hypothetical protein
LIQTAQLRRIQQTLDQLLVEVSQLVDEATFDQQLSDLNAAIDELIAAVNTHITEAHPDLTDESAAVLAATDKVKAAADSISGTTANGQPDQPPPDAAPPADASAEQPAS